MKGWPKDLPQLNTERLAHILYGYANGHGHFPGYGWHRVGEKVDIFPARYSIADIIRLLRETLETATPYVNENGTWSYRARLSDGNSYFAVVAKNQKVVRTFHPDTP